MSNKKRNAGGFVTESGFSGDVTPDLVDDQTARGVQPTPAYPTAMVPPPGMPPVSPHAMEPTPYLAATNPLPPLPAPGVSFAPPMDVAEHGLVSLPSPLGVPVPTMPMVASMEQAHQMAAMQQEMARMQRELREKEFELERLTETARDALTRTPAEPAPPPAPPAKEYKLYFVGQRYEEPKEGIPGRYVLDVMRDGRHYCSRINRPAATGGEEPYVFGASQTDPYPHAFISRNLGDWLIANDGPMVDGHLLQIRYRWSPEALAEFAREDHAAAVTRAQVQEAVA